MDMIEGIRAEASRKRGPRQISEQPALIAEDQLFCLRGGEERERRYLGNNNGYWYFRAYISLPSGCSKEIRVGLKLVSLPAAKECRDAIIEEFGKKRKVFLTEFSNAKPVDNDQDMGFSLFCRKRIKAKIDREVYWGQLSEPAKKKELEARIVTHSATQELLQSDNSLVEDQTIVFDMKVSNHHCLVRIPASVSMEEKWLLFDTATGRTGLFDNRFGKTLVIADASYTPRNVEGFYDSANPNRKNQQMAGARKLFGNHRVDGFLGLDFCRGRRLVLDFDAGKFLVNPKINEKEFAWTKVQENVGRYVFLAKLQEKRFSLLLHTGALHAAILSGNGLLRNSKAAKIPGWEDYCQSINESFKVTEAYQAKLSIGSWTGENICVGQHKIYDSTISALSDVDGIAGVSLLENARRVCLDFKNHRLGIGKKISQPIP